VQKEPTIGQQKLVPTSILKKRGHEQTHKHGDTGLARAICAFVTLQNEVYLQRNKKLWPIATPLGTVELANRISQTAESENAMMDSKGWRNGIKWLFVFAFLLK
jgi:hypothetical protein